MDSLQSVKATVQASQVKLAAPPEPAPKGKPQLVPPASARPVSQPDAEADRKARGKALKDLSDAQKRQFTATQRSQEAEARAQTKIREAEERAAAAEALVQQSKDDPMGFLEKHGIKMRQIAEKVAKGEPVTNEAKRALERAIAAEEATEKLKQELADRDAKSTQERAFLEAKRDLTKTFDEMKEKLPYFSRLVKKYGDTHLITEVQGMYREISADPRTKDFADQYTFAEVLEALEERWQERADALKEETAPPAEVAALGRPTAPKPSLTTQSASVANDLPPDFKKLPPKEQDKIIKAQYKALKGKK